jgi:hypothetical protein
MLGRRHLGDFDRQAWIIYAVVVVTVFVGMATYLVL